jgi:hypothetical protein
MYTKERADCCNYSHSHSHNATGNNIRMHYAGKTLTPINKMALHLTVIMMAGFLFPVISDSAALSTVASS